MARIFRTILALSTGVSLVGATLLGAAAYDLGSYPDKLVDKGVFVGKIVVGENADVPDVIGAIEIAANIQSESVTTKTSNPNSAYLSGDVKAVYGGTLEIRKKAATTFTPTDLKGLATGTVENSRGKTTFNQYLRFGATGFSPLTVNYLADDDNRLDDYLVLPDGSPFMEWTIMFNQGFESERDSDTGGLTDFEDKQIGLLGEPASIVDATIDADGTNLELRLMSGSVGDTLREGETRTYTIDGEPYEVTLAFVSDPNSGTVEAKFLINGEMSRALEEGETDEVGDTRLGVRDILVNSREGVASFYLGAHDVVLTDPTPTTEDYDGSVETDNNNINDGEFQAVGYFQNTNQTYRLAWLRYRFTSDADGGSDIYLSEQQHTIRELMDTPEGFLSDINIHYHGLTPLTRKDFKIEAAGDDQYELTFTNIYSKTFSVPLLSNKDGVWRYGDEDDDFIFVEGASAADHNIGIDDYVLLSNAKSGNDADKSTTVVMRYVDYDNANLVVQFESMDSSHALSDVPLSSDGIGYLYVGSSIFKVNVSNTTVSSPDISLDLDGDSGYGDKIKIVAYGGVIVNLAQTVYLNDSANVTLTDAGITGIVGNGKNISSALDFTDGSGFVQMNAQVLAKKFAKPDIDETFNWTISQAASDEVDLTFAASGYDGPFNTDTSDINYGFRFDEDDTDDDHTRGLTDYGIFIDLYDQSNDPAEFTFSAPSEQQKVPVYITIGSVRHDAPPSTLEKVNPIAVGIAILDSQAPALGTEHLIVVGGPCANSVAAELLGNPEVCTDGFTPGEAIIRSFETDGKVAVLVAGYEALSTQGAARVLAKHHDYTLAGEAVTVVVPDLDNIEVKTN